MAEKSAATDREKEAAAEAVVEKVSEKDVVINVETGEEVEVAAAPAEEPDADDDDEAPEDEAEGSEAEGADGEETVEERRERRRLQRKLDKIKRREKERQLRTENQDLHKKLAELTERVHRQEHTGHQQEISRVERAYANAKQTAGAADAAYQEAISRGDGAGASKAQQAWYDATRAMEQLEGYHKQLVSSKGDPEPTKKNPGLDPRVKAHTDAWMARNRWFDPTGGDEDSAIALAIDAQLSRDGLNPATKEYWEELDDRLSRRLPDVVRPKKANGQSKPRPNTGPSGKSTQSVVKPGQIRLSPDRVAAMKEIGVWDDPKERAKYIKAYAKYDKNQAKGA